MGIFSRIGKLFGRKERQDIAQAEYARQQATQVAQQAKLKAQRAAQAEKEAAAEKRMARLRREQAQREAMKTGRATPADRSKRAAADRETALAKQAEQRAVEQEARWRQERQRQERIANDARLKGEQARIREEQLRSKAREALLRTRKNMSDEDFASAFRGPRPERREYENVKTGEGDLPDKEMFLKFGVKYSAFASSNVEALVFDPTVGDLYVCYLKGRWYRYRGCGRNVASLMYDAASKGVAVHDELRVRGTVRGNKFATDKDTPPPHYLPLDSESSAGQFGAHGGF